MYSTNLGDDVVTFFLRERGFGDLKYLSLIGHRIMQHAFEIQRVDLVLKFANNTSQILRL